MTTNETRPPEDGRIEPDPSVQRSTHGRDRTEPAEPAAVSDYERNRRWAEYEHRRVVIRLLRWAVAGIWIIAALALVIALFGIEIRAAG